MAGLTVLPMTHKVSIVYSLSSVSAHLYFFVVVVDIVVVNIVVVDIVVIVDIVVVVYGASFKPCF